MEDHVEDDDEPVEHTLVADDGVELCYFELAPSDATPSSPVIITSAGFGGHDAASLLAALTKDGFRVVGFSVRGMGEVDVGCGALNVERVARDLHCVLSAIVEAAGADAPPPRVALLGNSFGVNVIWRLVDLFGEELVDRHVFIDQPICVSRTFDGKPAVSGLFPVLRHVLPNLPGCCLPAPMAGCDFAALADLFEGSEADDNAERLCKVTRPCLVYGGSHSFVIGSIENARAVAAGVSGPARLLIYDDARGTHSPQQPGTDDGGEGARQFCADVAAFLLAPEDVLQRESAANSEHF